MRHPVAKFIFCITLCQLAGIIGAFFTVESVATWYPTLIKPFYTPPSWLFAPVWATLYLLMAIAVSLIWIQKSSKKRNEALVIFWFSLFANVLWSPLFFGMRSIVLGLADISLMLTFIIWSIFLFFPLSRTAAYLMFPYAVWVGYAWLLNAGIFILN